MVMAKLFLPYLNKTEMSEVIIDVVYILNCTGVGPCGPTKNDEYEICFLCAEHVETVADRGKSGLFIH